jgi:hypothetical protein
MKAQTPSKDGFPSFSQGGNLAIRDAPKRPKALRLGHINAPSGAFRQAETGVSFVLNAAPTPRHSGIASDLHGPPREG